MSVTMEDSMTSSHIGSQSGSESGLLGSVSSLNDQDGICEQEPRTEDYVPQPGKVVSLGLIIYRPTSHQVDILFVSLNFHCMFMFSYVY